MEVHDLAQGTPEWHEYRASHRNASDAPAMLGCSPYKSRSELLHEYATGIVKEVDPITQKRFDDGHRYEALARPIAEQIIGRKLYPVVGSEGKYSASFDGLTADDSIGSEHKSLNEDLRAVMVDGCTGADLPKMYQVQMEQQCMVSGCERVLFMASKWEGENLAEERHCWYFPNAALRAEIIAGWNQFERDLAEYTPPEVVAEVVGRTPETLPALRIEVTGMVTASNLEQFKAHALTVFGGINRTLSTDQEFADAEKAVKWCSDVEDRLAAAKQHALSQTESIDALFRAIDEISAEARATRLELDKLVKARKEQIRNEILQEGVTALREHIAALNTRLGKPYMPTVPADFAGAMKGKRTIVSLRDAVGTTLANAKIEANAIADRIQTNLNSILALKDDELFKHTRAELPSLFVDLPQLVLKSPEDCAAVVANRVAGERARQEAEREHIAAEERAKAEAQAKAQMEATVTRTQAMMESHHQQRETESAEATGAEEKTVTILDNDPAFATPAKAVAVIHPAADTGARVRLGEINARIAPISITAEGLAQLGFVHVATEKSAKLYQMSDLPEIFSAIAHHIMALVTDEERCAA